MITLNKSTIQRDQYTGDGRPAQVLDHDGMGWSAVPHGPLLPAEAMMTSTDDPELYSDHTVRLQRQQTNSVMVRRLTTEGAIELGKQLIDAARQVDYWRRDGVLVSGGTGEGKVSAHLLANMQRKVEFDTGPENAKLVLGTDESPLQADQRTSPFPQNARVWAANELVVEFVAATSLPDDHQGVIDQAVKKLTKGEYSVDVGLYTLVFPSFMASPRMLVLDVTEQGVTTRPLLTAMGDEEPGAEITPSTAHEAKGEPGWLPEGPSPAVTAAMAEVFDNTLRKVDLDTGSVEDYRTAGQSPSWSKPEDDSAQPALGSLAVLAEQFLLRRGSGVLAMSLTDRGEWDVSLTWGREAPDSDMAGAQALQSGPTAADALREALHEAGESV